ncbi:bifunctional metallophosphatase/5'-nucleotidase [Levilactobacillus angrenensis]|uniref:Bifunctional metallophosphatase/5'-nucleotidase n=1 Tax=Levilactobacillus angrenensis TaxID=2486020 RepID=A0ABW1U9I1_9LACO|nr:bifunctional metallophosphatase/5'-nucleotidase [Levilactobacillus angrenensis]
MKLKILSTSDVHGYVYPTSYSRRDDHRDYGWLRAATVIRDVQAAAGPDEVVVTIENGDWIQGAPFASYLAQRPAAEAALFTQLTSQLGVDVGVLGNHEFNYGQDYLRYCEAQRTYPLVGANIQGGSDQGILDAPYHLIERQGLKIAVLGLTTAYVPVWERADHLTGLHFQAALATAKHWVPRLHDLADVVIVAYHGGFEADLTTGEPTERLTGENEGYQLLTQVPGIDALVTGHQHRQIAGVYHGVPTTQPGDKGVAVGEITLTLDADKHVVASDAQLLTTANAQPDAAFAAQTAAVQARVEDWLDQPVGQLTGTSMTVTDPMAARLQGHPYLQFINQIEMAAGQTDIAATALFNDDVRGFGPSVSVRQVLNSYPYPNTLVVERITGADLKAALERCASFFTVVAGQVQVAPAFTTPKLALYNYDIYSGIAYHFDLTQPVGQRVTQLVYHGHPVQPEQTLDVAMNQYRGNGGGDYPMFAPAKVIREINTDMAELIRQYFAAHPVVTGQPQTNFTVTT